MNKIILHASIDDSEWDNKFASDGIKAGDIDGFANGHEAILVQMQEFPIGVDRHMHIVTFEKSLDEVFVDWDDDVECVELIPEEFWDKDDIAYSSFATPEQLESYLLYGAYVKDIKSSEIVLVRKAFFDKECNFTIEDILTE